MLKPQSSAYLVLKQGSSQAKSKGVTAVPVLQKHVHPHLILSLVPMSQEGVPLLPASRHVETIELRNQPDCQSRGR